MSKRHHQRQVARARAKRQSDRFDRRRKRARVIAVVAAGAMLLGVVAIVLVTLLEGDPAAVDVDDEPLDEEPFDDGAAADAEACPEPEGAPEPEVMEYDEPEQVIDEDATYVATLETTCGQLVLELDASGAPTATNSFVFLAREGYFEGVPFHRVIPGFVIQGGDPTGTGTGGPGYTFEDELETAEELVAEHGGYPRGVLAMANAGPNTNGSQFFITLGDPVQLSPDFTVFGEVLDGMDVADRIARGPAENDMAIEPVRMLSVDIDEG